MAIGSKLPDVDSRSPAQKEADEAVAKAAESGNWEGFEETLLCTPEGARRLIEFRKALKPAAWMAELTKQPFRWKHYVFQLVRCEYRDGRAYVEAEPHEPEFVAEVKKRMDQSHFHVLPYYQGFGFVAFPEDHQRYKD